MVGLDVGSRSLKLAELELTPGGPRLIKTLIQELPGVPEGQAVDRVGWLQTALKEFSAGEVHGSVSGLHVAVRRLHLPLMSAKELREAVKWELREHIPFPIQDAVLDFHVLGDVWEKDVKKQDVLAVAAERSLVTGLISLVERAGGRVASLTPTHMATWRCLTTLVPEARQGSVAIIELGNRETEVSILKDGQIRLIRDLWVGVGSLSETLVGVVASERGDITIDRSKAEALTRRYGILADSMEGNTEEGLPLFHLASLMRPVLEDVVTELSRLFDFYKVQMEESGIARVFLCGAGANLKQLQPFLANELGLTIEVFNPLLRMTDRAQSLEPEQIAEDGPRLAVPIGLALDHGETLSLLPREVAGARASAASRQTWFTIGKVVAAGALALYLGLHALAGVLAWRIHDRQRDWERLQGTYTKYMRVTSAIAAMQRTEQSLQRFLDQQPVWEGLFKEIAELAPPTLILDALRVEPDLERHGAPHVSLQGHVVTSSAGSQGEVAEFLDQLGESVFFSDAKLVSSEMHTADTGTSSFTIEGRLE